MCKHCSLQRERLYTDHGGDLLYFNPKLNRYKRRSENGFSSGQKRVTSADTVNIIHGARLYATLTLC